MLLMVACRTSLAPTLCPSSARNLRTGCWPRLRTSPPVSLVCRMPSSTSSSLPSKTRAYVFTSCCFTQCLHPDKSDSSTIPWRHTRLARTPVTGARATAVDGMLPGGPSTTSKTRGSGYRSRSAGLTCVSRTSTACSRRAPTRSVPSQ
jgi:hypothetical protein